MADSKLIVERVQRQVATLRWRYAQVHPETLERWLAAAGLPALPGPGGLTATPESDLLVARRGPGEAWLVAPLESTPWKAALMAGSPAFAEASPVRAVDLSEAIAVLQVKSLQPGAIEALLPRLADAASLPERMPSASPCLLYDLPVLLLRPGANLALLCVDATLAPTLTEGLERAAAFD